MRIGSLFSGIGGLELGLEWAEVGETVWQVEIDPFCRAVLAQHWPHATRHEDVRAVGAHNLEPVDVICGGFPCQDISYAGKGAGLQGARSGLWYEFARVVGEMGPRFVVVENVRALLTRGIDQVLGTLADLGYDAEWSTLRASDVGAPHRRERVFLIAWLADSNGHGQPQREGSFAYKRGRAGDSGAELGHATRGRRGEGAGVEVRRVERGRDGVGDADSERGRCRRLGRDAGDAHASSEMVCGWEDATPVRGADGTVRLIPESAARWAQSAVRPLVNGISDELAGRGTSNKEALDAIAQRHATPRTEALSHAHGLRGVRCDGEPTAPSPELPGAGSRRDPVRAMSREGGSARRDQESEAAEELQAMRDDVSPNAQYQAQPVQREVSQRGRQTQRDEEMERALWPVAHAVPGRVARLRAIGNAVVPQVAEVVGRRLLAIRQDLDTHPLPPHIAATPDETRR